MAKMQARLQAVLRMARADEHGSLRSVDDVAADSSDDDLDTEPAKRNSKQRIAPSRSSKLNGKQSHQSFTPTVDSTASSETAESFEDASTKRVDGKKRQGERALHK